LAYADFRGEEAAMTADVSVVTPAPSEVIVRAAPVPDRLPSVDLLRGAVMVLMALDHVRDYVSDEIFINPTDLTQASPALFLTRWVTHFCAPTFIFLAGTGAFLSRNRGRSRADLSWFLLTRGLWLVFLELTVVRAAWWFNWDLYHHGPAIFWAIGWSMVALSALVFLPTPLIALFGVVMIAGHNLLDKLTAEDLRLPEWLWIVLHRPGEAPVVDGFTLGTGYCLIPWVGVMAAGYAFGTMLQLAPGVRRRAVGALGLALIAAFVVLRALDFYGDPNHLTGQPTVVRSCLSFLNCTKYPPSLLYLLMTLGPAIFALALFDRPLSPLARPIVTFGRVPLFFYLLHIPLIHGLAVLLDWARFGWSPLATGGPWDLRPGLVPDTWGVNLPVVYLLWVAVVVVLYFPCRWFAEVKRRHRSGWLSYL
jgi:uncharacterized membrane protein